MTDEKIEKSNKEEYSENSFWNKIKEHAKAIGCSLICKALVLYYTLQNPNCPKWAKTTIIGALAYLINFMDAIPDFTPIVGYTDDLGALAAAIALVAVYITDVEIIKAKEKAKELLDCDCPGIEKDKPNG